MLKDDFEGILRDFGHNILLVRQENKLRCSCWHEKNQEADRECPACFGLGMVPVIEKHTVRAQVMSVPMSLPRAVTNATFGDMVSSGMAYFFKPDVKVTVQDLIVEVDWSATGKPIYNGGDLMEVNFIQINRFEDGLPAFLKIFLAGQPIERSIRGIRITNSNGIRNYEII